MKEVTKITYVCEKCGTEFSDHDTCITHEEECIPFSNETPWLKIGDIAKFYCDGRRGYTFGIVKSINPDLYLQQWTYECIAINLENINDFDNLVCSELDANSDNVDTFREADILDVCTIDDLKKRHEHIKELLSLLKKNFPEVSVSFGDMETFLNNMKKFY